jgi:phosphatidylglycerol:prolipoprotein diacylglycerol transferase
MHSILFSPFGFDIYSYGFMLMIGFILAIYVTTKRARLAGIKPDFITDLAIWAIIVGVIGARVAYILEWKSQEAQRPFNDGWKIFNIFDGNMSALGALMGLVLTAAVVLLYSRFGKKRIILKDENGIRAGTAIALIVVAVVVTAVCARAWTLAITGQYVAGSGGQSPEIRLDNGVKYNLEYFAIRSGGLTFYGGFLPAAVVILLITWLRRYNTWKVADVIAPSLMLGLSFGRIGCFLNGCCWGLVCEKGFFSNIAVRFPLNSNPHQAQLKEEQFARVLLGKTSLPVIPTELIESLFAFSLFLFLNWYTNRKRRHGEVLALAAGIYAVGRFLIEFLRADHVPKWFGLSFSQNISMAVFVLAAAFFLYLRSRKQPEEAEREIAGSAKAAQAVKP